MTLTLLKRTTKGSALNVTEHDSNFTMIENEVNSKITTTDPRLSDARTPLAHQHPLTDLPQVQTALDLKATVASLTALTTTVDSKVGTADARLTDKRAIATGDYGAFTVASDGSATHNADALSESLMTLTGAELLALAEYLIEPLTSIPTAATFDDLIEGTSITKLFTPQLWASVLTFKTLTYSATPVIDFTSEAGANRASSFRLNFNCTGDCTASFKGVTGALVGQEVMVKFTAATAGAKTIGFANGSDGVSVGAFQGVTPLGTGANVGDFVIAWVFFESSTQAWVTGYGKKGV